MIFAPMVAPHRATRHRLPAPETTGNRRCQDCWWRPRLQNRACCPSPSVDHEFLRGLRRPHDLADRLHDRSLAGREPQDLRGLPGRLPQASDWIKAHPEEAADTFLRVAQSDLDRELILSILSDGKYSFDPVPRNTLSLATFMHDVGALKTRPESCKDYFFEDLHDREGS